jgi:hypothetical protein
MSFSAILCQLVRSELLDHLLMAARDETSWEAREPGRGSLRRRRRWWPGLAKDGGDYWLLKPRGTWSSCGF